MSINEEALTFSVSFNCLSNRQRIIASIVAILVTISSAYLPSKRAEYIKLLTALMELRKPLRASRDIFSAIYRYHFFSFPVFPRPFFNIFAGIVRSLPETVFTGITLRQSRRYSRANAAL